MSTSRSSTTAKAALQRIADTAPMLSWMTDTNDVVIHLNQSAAALVGQDEMLDIAAWIELIHPDDQKRVGPVFRQAKENRSDYQVEYRIVRSDGSVRWMLGSAAPRLSKDGAFLGYNGSIIDVTERHDALERMASSEAGYRLITENSSDVISHHAPDGSLIYVSPSVERALGFQPLELLGTYFYDHVHPDDKLTIHEEIARQSKGSSESRLIEFRKRHKDGRYVWMATMARVMVDPLTRKKAGTISVTRDITFERQTREELRKREERFRSLTNLSSDWYWETDEHGRFTFISDGIERLFGISVERVLGRTRFERTDQPDQPSLQEYAAKLARREPFKDIRYYATGATADIIRYASISGEPVFENGAFKGYRGVGHDITEQHALTEKVVQLAEENNALVENSLDLMLLLDHEGRILRANRASKDILGYAPEELVGKPYVQFLHAEDVEKTLAVDAGLRTGSNIIQDFETRCVRRDGSIARLSLSVRWLASKKLMYAAARDVTERYRIREQLQKSRDALSSMLESIGDAFFALDRNWRATYVNHNTARFLGRPRNELIGQVLWEAVPDLLHSPILPYYRTAMETGQKVFFEAYYEPLRAWLEIRAYPHEDGLSVFFHDITARRNAETAVRDNEQRFRELIEMTPAGYLVADAQATLLTVNPALCCMAGYTEQELVGRNLRELFPMLPCGGALLTDGGQTTIHGRESGIRHKQGHLIYVLANATIKRDAEGKAQSMTAFLTDITQRKEAEARLEQLATHDTLTALPNRTLLNDRVEQMITSADQGEIVAVMFIDLDQFKQVNDSWGHKPGDVLLQEVARRLEKVMRPGDIVARLGGDEFVVAVKCVHGADSAIAVAERLLSSLKMPIDIEGNEVFVTASIGISLFPEDGSTKELLFQNADTAMYRAKAAGRNTYRFFKAEMSIEAKTRMTLEHALRRALERNEFELYFQPRLSLKTMAIVGMEALIRWNHPELGQVPPLQFIPIAEEKGLIEPIGRWVLEQACMHTRHLIDKYARSLRVSVNLSARQLKCTDLPRQVTAALESAGLQPGLLELELTETALIEDMDASARLLNELKQLGICLSVDDFGTGYSGLAYLRRFPLDTLKLDRSFLIQQDSEPNHFAFIEAFVDLAHALNLSVVAEGVETHDTLLFLRGAACDEAQGYLFAKPMPLPEFEAFLARLPAPTQR